MKLFTIGPVQMYSRTLKAKSEPVPYFRTNEFSKLMLRVDSQLKQIIGTSESSKCVYLTASGTGAMEATIFNCFSERDKLLIVVGGTFGKRFSQICDIHKIPHENIVLNSEEELTEEHLKPFYHKGFTGFLVNLDETSTGQLYDINLISKFCKENNLYLVIDAITTFLCDRFDMDKYNADAVILSSQKGLCLSPGISIVVLNEKIINQKVINNNPKSLYFDFKDYLNNISRGQTPFTPAVGILCELSNMLEYLLSVGIEKHLLIINERAKYFRSRINEIEARIPNFKLSNAITPVIFKKPVASKIFSKLKNDYSLIVNPTGGKMADYQLRISHIGNLSIDDYSDLIDKIKIILGEEET